MYSISNPAVSEQAGFYAAGSLTAMAIAYLIQGTHTGAGIGGDEGGFGTIDIKNSHIYAQGGKYGAGIGSGDEAEDCGTINITDSEITANGGSEGAGIGTGNETDETANINISNSTVDAHGGDLAAGIGGGDDVDGGTIKISDSIVKAYGGKDAAGIGGGDSFVCTKCNVSAELSHIKFIERDNSGEHTTDFDTPVGTYYELPECKHVPDGYRFVCWKINDYGMMPGDIDLASGNYTVHALYLPAVQTTYIDEEGKEQTVQACRLNSNDVMLGDSFYVIDQNMESGNIMLVSGDAKLIIADGVTYTSAVGSYDPPVDCDLFNPSSLTIFGQREQTGTLDLSRTYYPAQIYHFTQYGARLTKIPTR